MRVRRRSFGDFVKAFLAFVVLLVLVVGCRAGHTIGWPLPDGMPGLDWLQREITVSTFLHILTVVVWFAWAQFTACVLVEVKAALSGARGRGGCRVRGQSAARPAARRRPPARRRDQRRAPPGLSQLGQSLEGASSQSVAAAQQTPGLFAQQQEQAASTANALAEQARAGRGPCRQRLRRARGHEVLPDPAARGTPPRLLWEIADRHLGDGRRYKEIFELNKDRVQPDGSKLSEASLIRPGLDHGDAR